MIRGSERARSKHARYAVLCCGSRNWTDREAIRARLQGYPDGTLVLHGGWDGADLLSHEIAMSLGFHVWPVFYFFAFGRSGGPRRNACMLEVLLVLQKHGYTVAVEAFDLGGRGTADMIDRARRAQVRVEATHG